MVQRVSVGTTSISVSASDVSVSAACASSAVWGVSDARGQQVDEVVERDSRDRLGRSRGGGTARW